MPVLAGCGFCALQVGLFVVRFGFRAPSGIAPGPPVTAAEILPSLGLFLLGGLLAALVVRRLLRGAEGRWQLCLICLTIVATPIALLGSLAGGLLGSVMVVLWAVAPYLLFVGIPVLGHRLLRGRKAVP